VDYNRVFLIAFTVGIIFSILPFVTAEESVTVSTDKDIYYEEDVIVVFGNISGAFGGLPVTIQLYHEETLIAVDQIEVALDGSYATDFKASGQFWKEDGTYIARAFYTPEKIAEKTFQFYEKRSDSASSVFPVDIPNAGSFNVGYSIIGGEVKDITLKHDRYSILIQLTADTNGDLVLKLPRESIDAKINDSEDDTFIVLISKSGTDDDDFVEIEFEELGQVGNDRTLRIQFEEDDKWIEVIGTYAIPEFGTIAVMILIIAVISIIIITKTKLPLKYN
jgi:predicted secreted protein with PEFG-CTERM motif